MAASAARPTQGTGLLGMASSSGQRHSIAAVCHRCLCHGSPSPRGIHHPGPNNRCQAVDPTAASSGSGGNEGRFRPGPARWPAPPAADSRPREPMVSPGATHQAPAVGLAAQVTPRRRRILPPARLAGPRSWKLPASFPTASRRRAPDLVGVPRSRGCLPADLMVLGMAYRPSPSGLCRTVPARCAARHGS
jgi:hypothetical protein